MDIKRFVLPLAGLAMVCVPWLPVFGDETAKLGDCTGIENSIYWARAAERRGDVESAASSYQEAIVALVNGAPRGVDLSKVVLCGESAPSIGRRMLYWQIKFLEKELASKERTISLDYILKNIQADYERMAWIEPKNPTWPYLVAVSYAADHNYRAAFAKCREAAQCPGGQESVRQKARSLARHIKSGALAQEAMKQSDQEAYAEYVRSGAQALDFAMVSARCSADEARKRGDQANADMWESRYHDYSRQRAQVK